MNTSFTVWISLKINYWFSMNSLSYSFWETDKAKISLIQIQPSAESIMHCMAIRETCLMVFHITTTINNSLHSEVKCTKYTRVQLDIHMTNKDLTFTETKSCYNNLNRVYLQTFVDVLMCNVTNMSFQLVKLRKH